LSEIDGTAIALGKSLNRINNLSYFGVISKCEDRCVKISTEVAMYQKQFLSFRVAVPIVLTILSITGCSTIGPPKDSVAAADLAVREANKSKAPQYSPLELRRATDKLDEAKRAMDKEEYTRARRLAEEALVDAQLAEAKAASEDARRTASDVRQSLETLRREAQRSSGGD
jgi:Domain of unknown function (DUF4398)